MPPPTIRKPTQSGASATLRIHTYELGGSAGSLGLEVDPVDQQAAVAGQVVADHLESQAGAGGCGVVLDRELLPAAGGQRVAGLVGADLAAAGQLPQGQDDLAAGRGLDPEGAS